MVIILKTRRVNVKIHWQMKIIEPHLFCFKIHIFLIVTPWQKANIGLHK